MNNKLSAAVGSAKFKAGSSKTWRGQVMSFELTASANIAPATNGAANVASLVHCATRLRFKLHNNDKADAAKVKTLDGVRAVKLY